MPENTPVQTNHIPSSGTVTGVVLNTSSSVYVDPSFKFWPQVTPVAPVIPLEAFPITSPLLTNTPVLAVPQVDPMITILANEIERLKAELLTATTALQTPPVVEAPIPAPVFAKPAMPAQALRRAQMRIGLICLTYED